jgi:fucose permease
MPPFRRSDGFSLVVLHGAFALTGVMHSIGGALLPSVALAFHLSDKQSGSLFFLYFMGAAIGALLCVGRYARLMTLGFLVVAASCFAIANAGVALLMPLFFILGVGVGIPMSAVTIFAGRKFGDKSAAPLTLLNCSWSGGALLAPLFAAQILLSHTYRTAYLALAVVAVIAAAACWLVLDEPSAQRAPHPHIGIQNLSWIALFSLLTFLEVGIENTTATWLATYAMRGAHTGIALAAASSSLYWCGFLISRGLSSLALMRIEAARLLQWAVFVGLIASAALVGFSGAVERGFAMLALGMALAPVFPLLLARFFARARNASDSRWVLSVCGFGGSVLPWLTGSISTAFSLRIGLVTVPAALTLILALLPLALGPSTTFRVTKP